MQTILTQILAHVPTWVWAILAFIVVMGIKQSRDQSMSRGRLLILPIVWLAFGFWGVETTFGLNAAPLLAWVAGLAASLTLIRRSGWPGGAYAEGARYFVPGSWLPMALMLTIFCAKFALGMSLAMSPALAQQTAAAIGFSALFGALGGAFLGRSRNILARGVRPAAGLCEAQA